MRKTIAILFLTAFAFGIQIASAQDASQSQSQSQSQAEASKKPAASKPQAQKESVADAARKAQEANKTTPKAPIVFDNDNIGAAAGSSTVNVVGNAPAAESSASASAKSGKAGASSSSSSSNDEAAWRQKFADARTKLQQDQSELAIMQRELQQLRVQYYPNDPQKALKQSVSNEDVNKKQQAIAQKQKQIQADQQAISDLQDQLRKAGGDSSWSRQ